MLKKSQIVVSSALVLAAATLAHAQSAPPTKIGIIHVQAAILSTKEGKKAGDELNSKFGQRKAELEKKQAGIYQLKDQLQKGSATMSDEAKNKLMRQIDGETTSLKRATEELVPQRQRQRGIHVDVGHDPQGGPYPGGRLGATKARRRESRHEPRRRDERLTERVRRCDARIETARKLRKGPEPGGAVGLGGRRRRRLGT